MKPIHKCRGRWATSSCCTSSNKCEDGEGHCSSDSHCGDGLKCGQRNCDYSLGFRFDYNCCYKPNTRSPPVVPATTASSPARTTTGSPAGTTTDFFTTDPFGTTTNDPFG